MSVDVNHMFPVISIYSNHLLPTLILVFTGTILPLLFSSFRSLVSDPLRVDVTLFLLSPLGVGSSQLSDNHCHPLIFPHYLS